MAVNLERLRSLGVKMLAANKAYDTLLKQVLPVGKAVACITPTNCGPYSFTGVVTGYVSPDEAEIVVTPDEQYRVVMQKLLHSGHLIVSIKNLEFPQVGERN